MDPATIVAGFRISIAFFLAGVFLSLLALLFVVALPQTMTCLGGAETARPRESNVR